MVITLLTDFGDLYPASMKGVTLCIDPAALYFFNISVMIQIIHDVHDYYYHSDNFL